MAGRGPQATARRRFGFVPDLLLLGHSDTARPAGTAAIWPFTRTGETITGPGGDMKSNLATAAAALVEALGES